MDGPIITLRGQGGAVVRIDRFPVVLGRSIPGAPVQPDCDVAALDPRALVSKQHARLEWHEGERLHAVDMGSTNGTSLDGMKLEPDKPIVVQPGAKLALADVELMIEWEPTAAAVPPMGAAPVGAMGGPPPPPPFGVPGGPPPPLPFGGPGGAPFPPPPGGPGGSPPFPPPGGALPYPQPPGGPPPFPPPPGGPSPFGGPGGPGGQGGAPPFPPPPGGPPPFGGPGGPEDPGGPPPYPPPPGGREPLGGSGGTEGLPPFPPPPDVRRPFGAADGAGGAGEPAQVPPPFGGPPPFPPPPGAAPEARLGGLDAPPPPFAAAPAPPLLDEPSAPIEDEDGEPPLPAPAGPAGAGLPPFPESASPQAPLPGGPRPDEPAGARESEVENELDTGAPSLGEEEEAPPKAAEPPAPPPFGEWPSPKPPPLAPPPPFGALPPPPPPAWGVRSAGSELSPPAPPHSLEKAPKEVETAQTPSLAADEPAAERDAEPALTAAADDPLVEETEAHEEVAAELGFPPALPPVLPRPTGADAFLPPLTLPPLPPIGAAGARPLPPPGAPAPDAPAPDAPAPDRGAATIPEPGSAVSAPAGAGEATAILAALDDPDTREIVVIAGRRPRVRTADGWKELGFEVSPATWDDLWRDVAERTGAPPQPGTGHVAHLGRGGLVVEAMLPPLSEDPVLHIRRRPPAATLDTWVDEGRFAGNADAVRDALLNRRGVLVVGDRSSGRTALLEALAGGTAPGERVAACEVLPQLRVAGALRLRLDSSNPAPALSAARAAMAEWLVLDDASPQAVGAAVVEAEANRAGLLVSARTADAEAWLGQVARSIAYEIVDADAFVRSALPVVVRVEAGPGGRPQARVETS